MSNCLEIRTNPLEILPKSPYDKIIRGVGVTPLENSLADRFSRQRSRQIEYQVEEGVQYLFPELAPRRLLSYK